MADPDHPSVPWLRIGLDQPHNHPPQIARFGWLSHNDIILPGNGFSRTDQCYFSFNKDSGELLLRDISEEGSTHLYLLSLGDGKLDISKAPCLLTEVEKQPRQCVVLLGTDFCGKKHQYAFRIRKAEFWLIPPTADTTVDDQVSQVIAKLAFANGDHVEQTVDGTLERIVAAAMRIESLKGNTASTARPATDADFPKSTTGTESQAWRTSAERERYVTSGRVTTGVARGRPVPTLWCFQGETPDIIEKHLHGSRAGGSVGGEG